MAVFPIASSLINKTTITHRAAPKRNIVRHYSTKEAVKNVAGGLKEKISGFFRKAFNDYLDYVNNVGKNFRT